MTTPEDVASTQLKDATSPPPVKMETETPPVETEAEAVPTAEKEGTTAPVIQQGKTEQAVVRTDQNDRYNLLVKKEFVLTVRAASLPSLEPPTKEEAEDNDGWSKNKKKKKRPRDARIESADKICLAIMRGKSCPYGDKCRFSHDMKAYMVDRPKDVESVAGKGCHIYNEFGFCMYGAMCRFGASHVNMATGDNIRKDPDSEGVPPALNALPKEVQLQLRKRKYPFKMKRYDEKKVDSKPKAQEEDKEKVDADPKPKDVAVDMSPLPTLRKIIDFSNKVYVAPLTTVGNLPFRRVMKRLGADITCGEMALASNLLMGQPSEWALLKRHPEEDIFGVQIAASYPDMYTRVSEIIEAEMTVDFMDLNLGCPLDMVCQKGAGSALMMKDKRLKECLRGITSTLSCPVTIKMRTGWDMAHPFAHQLVPKIQSWGIDGIAAVMIHGRSRLQRYSKQADWEYISRASTSQDPSVPLLPIIGNGDIFSFEEYEAKKTHEGISSCAMIGRGALIKPWLPTEIKEKRHWDISASERLDILKDFVRFGLEHWGSDQQGINNCRRFLLEWLSYLNRYVPVGMLEVLPQYMNQRPPVFLCGRNDLETLFLSDQSADWIKISEMLLGPVPDGFRFDPKHKSSSYTPSG